MEKNPNPKPFINKTPFNVRQQVVGTVSRVGTDGDGIVDPLRNSGVIYFENFPRNWRYHDLEKVFARYDAIGRVSLASKRTKRNVSFGFFQSESNKDTSAIIDQLNLVAIGRFKLRAFRAKFPEKKQNLAPVLKKEDVVVRTVSSPAFRDRRSYREVTSAVKEASDAKVVDSSSYRDTLKPHDLSITLPNELITVGNEWMDRSIIARVIDVGSILKVKKVLFNQKIEVENISLVGGNQVILTFHSSLNAEKFLSCVGSKLLNYFQSFSWVNNCNQAFSRLVWVSISGLPYSLWSTEVFREIGNSIGEAILVHPDVNTRNRVDMGFVLITTNCRFINHSLQVNYGNKSCKLFVLETDKHVTFEDVDGEVISSREDVAKSPRFSSNNGVNLLNSFDTVVLDSIIEQPKDFEDQFLGGALISRSPLLAMEDIRCELPALHERFVVVSPTKSIMSTLHEKVQDVDSQIVEIIIANATLDLHENGILELPKLVNEVDAGNFRFEKSTPMGLLQVVLNSEIQTSGLHEKGQASISTSLMFVEVQYSEGMGNLLQNKDNDTFSSSEHFPVEVSVVNSSPLKLQGRGFEVLEGKSSDISTSLLSVEVQYSEALKDLVQNKDQSEQVPIVIYSNMNSPSLKLQGRGIEIQEGQFSFINQLSSSDQLVEVMQGQNGTSFMGMRDNTEQREENFLGEKNVTIRRPTKNINLLGNIVSCSDSRIEVVDEISDAGIDNMNRLNEAARVCNEPSTPMNEASKTWQIGHDLSIFQRETRSATLRKLEQIMASNTSG